MCLPGSVIEKQFNKYKKSNNMKEKYSNLSVNPVHHFAIKCVKYIDQSFGGGENSDGNSRSIRGETEKRKS